jgi:hypothetical protein
MRSLPLFVFLSFALLSCVTDKDKSPALPAASIASLSPAKVVAGQPFNVQPNGASAMSVMGANLIKGSKIKLNGVPLETASGDGSSLAAIIPLELFAKEGSFVVSVETPDGRATNTLPWVVLPKTGPAPVIVSLHPDNATAATPFNVQGNGDSAMGLVGQNFLPGTQIIFAGRPLDTSFGDVDKLAVIVPADLYAKAGTVQVIVKNPDGKTSAPKPFVIKAK